MRFSCEIHNGTEAMLLEYLRSVDLVSNITTYELISGMCRHFFDIPQVSRIGQQVEVHDLDVFARSQNVANKTGADESGAARYKDFHCCLRIEAEVCRAASEISSELCS